MKKPQSSYEVQVIHDWTFCRSQTVGLCGWLGVIMVVYNESHVRNCSKNAGVSMETASWFHVLYFQMSCLLPWSQVRKFTGTERSFWNITRCWFVTLRSSSSKPNRVHSVQSRLVSQDSSKVTKHVVSRVFRLVSWNLKKKSCSGYRQMATVLEVKIFTASSQCFVTLLGRSVC